MPGAASGASSGSSTAWPSGSKAPPRLGSLTVSLKIGAMTTPARPTQMKAMRQSMAAAIRPPNRMPLAVPMGMPKL